MLFPTTIVFALLATITPVYSVPITNSPDALAVRSEHDSLEARNIAFAPAVEVEKREDESYEDILARDSDLYEDLEAREEDIYQELMVRSPEPEIEDMERRGKIGFVVKAAEKIGGFIKKIASKPTKPTRWQMLLATTTTSGAKTKTRSTGVLLSVAVVPTLRESKLGTLN